MVDEQAYGLLNFLDFLLNLVQSNNPNISTHATLVLRQIFFGVECEFARSVKSKFFQRLLEFSGSRRWHLRQCAETMTMVLAAPQWSNIVSDYYKENVGNIVDDILGFRGDTPSLRSRIVHDWLCAVLDCTSARNKDRLQFLFALKVFPSLFFVASTKQSVRFKQPNDQKTNISFAWSPFFIYNFWFCKSLFLP
jgi:hypothetical protein